MLTLGIPQQNLREYIAVVEARAAADFDERKHNWRAFSSLAGTLEELVYLHSWAGSEAHRVKQCLKDATLAYAELISWINESKATDRSDVSSCRTFRILSAAWILGEEDGAIRLATEIGDPPNAAYVGPKSEICRSDRQQFALAIREFVVGSGSEALQRCRRVGALREDVAAWTTILNGILQQTGERMPGALQALVDSHEREAHRKKYPFNIEYGVCLEALGLIAIALRRRLVDLEQLPQSQFLPYHLIQLT